MIKFSTRALTYYESGGVLSETVESGTLFGLKTKIQEMVLRAEHNVEVITFEPIEKFTSKRIQSKGRYHRFKKITNPYMYGEDPPDHKFHVPLEK